jgi:hypothetical protein
MLGDGRRVTTGNKWLHVDQILEVWRPRSSVIVAVVAAFRVVRMSVVLLVDLGPHYIPALVLTPSVVPGERNPEVFGVRSYLLVVLIRLGVKPLED